MTAGETITAALAYYLNAGSSSVVRDAAQRQKAHFFLTRVFKRVWESAPYWFRLKDGTVSLSSGVGTMPTDFAHLGTQGRLYVQGQRYLRLTYRPPDIVKGYIESSPQTGQPRIYTLYGQSSAGVPKILCYPQDSSTLDILAYVKKAPELIDIPSAPLLAVGAAGALTGAVTGCVTYVTASGETEGGDVSASLTLAAQKVNWSSIPVWSGRTVTSRKLYRTALGGTQRKLVTTIANNTDTTYTGDNVLDGALGADVPTVATSVSGLEVLPEMFHESVLYDGLVALLSTGQGDGREDKFDAKWAYNVRRMWEEYQQGQEAVRAFPAFPGRMAGHPMWSRFSPPQ